MGRRGGKAELDKKETRRGGRKKGRKREFVACTNTIQIYTRFPYRASIKFLASKSRDNATGKTFLNT
jgi:hypothetical protein